MMRPQNGIIPSLKFTLECIEELVDEHLEVCEYLQKVLGIERWDELLTLDQDVLAHAELAVEYGCARRLCGETELFAVAAAAIWKIYEEDKYLWEWDVQWSPLEKAIRSLTLLDSPAERTHYAAEFEDAQRRAGISRWTDLLRYGETDLCSIGAYAWNEYRAKVCDAITNALDWRREMDCKEDEVTDGLDDNE